MGLWAVAVLSAQRVAGEVLGVPHLHHLYVGDVGDVGDAAQGREETGTRHVCDAIMRSSRCFVLFFAPPPHRTWHYASHCGNHAIPGNDVGALVASPSLKPRSDTIP